MNYARATTTTMGTISRLGLGLAVTLLVGLMQVPEVDATKNNGPRLRSIASRAKDQMKNCENMRGHGDVKEDGLWQHQYNRYRRHAQWVTCVNTKQSTKCHQVMPAPPAEVPDVPPSGGVNEGPTGGGANPGGGAAFDPTGVIEQPDDPVTIQAASYVTATTDDDGKSHQGERRQQRRHHGNGRNA